VIEEIIFKNCRGTSKRFFKSGHIVKLLQNTTRSIRELRKIVNYGCLDI
jgi:hypothetical protein